MGMTRDEVEAVLGESMEYWMESGSYSGGHQGKVGNDIYIFDKNMQLVKTQKNFYHPDDVAKFGQPLLETTTELFGTPETRQSNLDIDGTKYRDTWHTWEIGEYRIILSRTYNITHDRDGWVSYTIAK